MGFYKDGKWQPCASEIASGAYAGTEWDKGSDAELEKFNRLVKKHNQLRMDVHKLKEWCLERYAGTNHNYFLEMSDKMNELNLWGE